MHVADCPDRASFDKYKYNVNDNKHKREPIVIPEANYSAVASEENWDDVCVLHVFRSVLKSIF